VKGPAIAISRVSRDLKARGSSSTAVAHEVGSHADEHHDDTDATNDTQPALHLPHSYFKRALTSGSDIETLTRASRR
jgi:hypothetical protein